mgnify:CR=1 FL=1
MQNISIKGVCDCVDLDRNIKLTNGAIVIQKENNNVIAVSYTHLRAHET